MNTSKRSSPALAIVLTVLGALLILTSLLLSDFNLSSLSSLQFTDRVYRVDADFDSVSVEEIDCNVAILPSADDVCTVVAKEAPHLYNTVAVENGTLTVRRVDERAWHERIIVFGAADPTLTVYLPKEQYDVLRVRTTAGNLSVDAPLCFRTVTMKSVGGDIAFTAEATEEISLSSTSGNVSADGINTKELSVTTASGAITLHRVKADVASLISSAGSLRLESEVTANRLFIEATEGNVLFNDVTVTTDLEIHGGTGSIALFSTDFASAYVETSSGNVTGTLRSKKQFDVQTQSGVVILPESTSGDVLRVKTVSGNVSFSFIENE